MSKQFSSDLKMKAVKYYHKVDNYSKVCKIFECSERSLKRWVEKYEINKTLERKKREEKPTPHKSTMTTVAAPFPQPHAAAAGFAIGVAFVKQI